MKIQRRNACSRIAMALAAAAITSATFGAINAAVTPPTPSVAVVRAPVIRADTDPADLIGNRDINHVREMHAA